MDPHEEVTMPLRRTLQLENQDINNAHLSSHAGRTCKDARCHPQFAKGLLERLLLMRGTRKPLLEEEGGRSHQLGVDLCVQPGVADEVDDPSLGLLGGHVQLVRQHAVEETETRAVIKAQRCQTLALD